MTDEQARAVVTRDTSVVLSSGAGCGKTHVLTERYLSHLRRGEAGVPQIVAITFTEKAAREMRKRIRAAITQHLRSAANDREAADWADHLRDLEAAPISTIHSFCAALLRQFAVEAGLDARFEVLEDVLAFNLEDEALSACLQRLLTDGSAAGQALGRLVPLYGWRPVVEGVRGLVRAWDERGWRAWLDLSAERAATAWRDRARELLPRHLRHFLAVRPAVGRCLELLARPLDWPEKMRERVAVLREALPCLAEAPDLAAAVESVQGAAVVQGVVKKHWPSDDIYEEVKDAFERLRKDLGKLNAEAFTPDGEPEQAVAIGRDFLLVAAEAVRAYRERKRLHAVVDFQDLLVLTRDLLRDDAGVRRQVQDRYRFLLIDELQDTDPVQMEVVELVCGPEMHRGKLFAVGDAKQSIYRFRGADVHLFRRLRDDAPQEGRQSLTLNFRSRPAVLNFVNALFAGQVPDYEPLRAHRPQVAPGPCVEFLWADRPEDATEHEARRAEADNLARRIAAMVGGEELVIDRETGKPRPVRQRDVVLLFRAMTNAPTYEEALRRHGLDYYLVGGRAFFAQQEVYDLLNLLRAVENPQDGVSLAGTLRSPFCCVSDEGLYVLARHPDGLWAGLLDEDREALLPADQRAPVRRARRNLLRWRTLKDRLPIARLLGEVLADSGYDAAVRLEHLGERKLANLWKLIDLARTFDRSGLFGPAEFIARLGDLVRTEQREEQAATLPESADVVQIMSIHQAKGLEFPVVFVPNFAGDTGPDHLPAAVWDPRLGCVARPPKEDGGPLFPEFGWKLREAGERLEEWEESLRTLYVACTRAEDHLVLSAALAPAALGRDKEWSKSAWMFALSRRFDLATGRCRDEAVAAEHQPEVRVVQTIGERQALDGKHQGADAPRSPAVVVSAGDLAAMRPVAPVVGARAVVPVAALSSTAGAEPFDAEDGADRNDWPDSRERAWEAFAAGPGKATLAAARSCRWGVEFVLDLGDPGEELPLVRGRIDGLWEDHDGQWHLALCAGAAGWHALSEAKGVESNPSRPSLRSGCATHPGTDDDVALAVAAEAVRRQTGAWPRTVTRIDGEGGAVVGKADAAAFERGLAEARRTLRALARRPLVD